MHLLACMVVIVLEMAWVWRVLLCLMIALSAWHSLRTHAWRSHSQALVALALQPDGDIRLRCRNGRVYSACQLRSSLVLPALVVLSLLCRGGHRLNLVLAADAVDAEALRRLRVRLLQRHSVSHDG